MPSRMSQIPAATPHDDSLTSLPSPQNWVVRKRIPSETKVRERSPLIKCRATLPDLCRDDEVDTVTTRPLEEESESTIEHSSLQLHRFQLPSVVSFQLPIEEHCNHPPLEWSDLNPDVIWWSKLELQNIYKQARQEAHENIANGCYKLMSSAFTSIHQQGNESSGNPSIMPLLSGSAAQQLLLHANHIRGLERFAPHVKIVTASHLQGILTVQRVLSEKEIDHETQRVFLRKASRRSSTASNAIAFLLARANCLEVREMLQEELSKRLRAR